MKPIGVWSAAWRRRRRFNNRSCRRSSRNSRAMTFAWGHHPCGKLGGDMFNVVALGDGQVGLYVLDVTGEGVPAALLATALSRVLAPASDPTSILVSAERRRVRGAHSRAGGGCPGIEPALWHAGRAGNTLRWRMASCTWSRAGSSSPAPATRRCLHLQAGRAPTMLDVEGFPIGMAPEAEPVSAAIGCAAAGRPHPAVLRRRPRRPACRRRGIRRRTALDAVAALQQRIARRASSAALGELRDWRGDAAANEDVSILGFKVSVRVAERLRETHAGPKTAKPVTPTFGSRYMS